MTHSQPTPTWPFLSILVALFILSLSAPRSWESVARNAPLGNLSENHVASPRATAESSKSPEGELVLESQRVYGTPTLAPPLVKAPHEEEPTYADALALSAEESHEALSWPDLVGTQQTCDAPKAGGPMLQFPVASSHTETMRESGAVTTFVDPLGIIPQWLTTTTSDALMPAFDGTAAETMPRVASRTGGGDRLKLGGDTEITSRWTPSLSDEETISPDDVAQFDGSSQSMWREPVALLDSLDHLAWECSCSDWAVRVSALVRELTRGKITSPEEAEALLSELRGEVERVDALVAAMSDYHLASEVRRLQYALARRVAVWSLAVRLESNSDSAVASMTVDPQPLATVLDKVDALVDQAGEHSGWREYLMLDALGVLAQSRQGHVTERTRELADLVLARLDADNLNPQQRHLVNVGPIASLGKNLHAWAARSVEPSEFLRALEQYEATGLPSDAANLARLSNQLLWSSDDDQQQLASTVNRYYRNANLRIALSEELIDLFLPADQLQRQRVHETIVGVPVRGNSTVRTNIGIDLLPDDGRLRMTLDISGQVSARTRAGGDWGGVFNRSDSRYAVREPLVVGREGLQLGVPTARVNSHVRLEGVETKLDGIPLLGSLAKSLVRRGQEKRGPEARRESEQKIRRRALQQATEETGTRFKAAEKRFEQEIVKPLTAMGLDPTIIEMKTTDQRLTIRARIAGVNQLGSHTPRPRAPSDSLASVQLHQTAVNNLIERLDLDGRDMSLAKLHTHVMKKLGREPEAAPKSMPEEVRIRFAAHNAVRVVCEDNRVRVSMAIEELSKRPRRWNNFTVHVNYRPTENVADGRLARDGTIQLAGRRLNLGSQIALRGVFSKIFSDDGLQFLPERIRNDPRFSDIEITQLVVTDGWIAAALGPKRSDRNARMAQDGQELTVSNMQ